MNMTPIQGRFLASNVKPQAAQQPQTSLQSTIHPAGDSVQFSGRLSKALAAVVLPLGLMSTAACSASPAIDDHLPKESQTQSASPGTPKPSETSIPEAPETSAPSSEAPESPESIKQAPPAPETPAPSQPTTPPAQMPSPSPSSGHSNEDSTPPPTDNTHPPEVLQQCGNPNNEDFGLAKQTHRGAQLVKNTQSRQLSSDLHHILRLAEGPYAYTLEPPIYMNHQGKSPKEARPTVFAPEFNRNDTVVVRSKTGPVREVALTQERFTQTLHIKDSQGTEYIATQASGSDVMPMNMRVMAYPQLQQVGDRAAKKTDVKAFSKLLTQANKLVTLNAKEAKAKHLEVAVFGSQDKGKVCYEPLQEVLKKKSDFWFPHYPPFPGNCEMQPPVVPLPYPIHREPLNADPVNFDKGVKVSNQPIPRDPQNVIQPNIVQGVHDKGHPIPRDHVIICNK